MASLTLKRHYSLALVYGLLTLTPPILYVFCVLQNAVDIPYMDEWTLVELKLKAASDSVSLKDVFAFHNEHRIASLRLISLAVDKVSTGLNSTSRMFISYIISIFNFLLIVLLAWQQSKSSITKDYSSKALHLFGLTTVITSLLFFFPSQHENWLWGFQVPWFLINLFLVSAVFLLYLFLKTRQKIYYLAALLLCFLASFTLAQGLFVWVACLPMFLTAGLKIKTRLTYIGIWLIATAIAAISYMVGYSQPIEDPNTGFVLTNLAAMADFFLNLLGNAFGRGGSSFILGLLMLLAYVSLIGVCYKQQARVWNEALTWISIGLFPIIFAAITTVGRIGFGSSAALASRYTTVTLLLPICLVQLLRIVIQQKGYGARLTRPLAIILVLSGFVLANLIDGYENGLANARQTLHDRNRGKACLELHEYLEPLLADQCITKHIFPVPALPLDLANGLREKGLISASPIVISSNVNQPINGHLDEIWIDNSNLDGMMAVTGWAFSEGHPGVVLLSSDAGQSFFAIVEVKERRTDVAAAYSKRYLNTGWKTVIPLSTLPANVQLLTAYFYDFDQREVYKVGQAPIFNNETMIPRARFS